jgi:CRP-like cAMP-binding protein
MFEQIEKATSRIIKLEKSELELFLSLLSPKKVKKKEMVLRTGQECRHLYFINKGCLRYFYITDGQEKTAQFFFENGWFTDLESFLKSSPSEIFVEAIEASELLLLEKNNLYQLYEQVPKFEKMGRILAENAYLGIQQKTKILTTLSSTERYLQLMNERPKVFERIPQQYIASYLNLTPQSLSIIRRQIQSKV